ncbi:hypothetical protein [uncultured Shewanella sp.]|uniref:hypothetical protein n=1 Tax=uncultured Shewanella sp. TaxID=173975 RepID=UPI002625A147|nr:hypothetical protein [uncultured Shewanella sp.]
MKTLTHLSVFSVLFFSVAAFANSSGTQSRIYDKTGQEQTVPQKSQKLISTSNKVQPNQDYQSQLTASTDNNGGKASLLGNTDKKDFNQSQQDKYRTIAAKPSYQFANNMDSKKALASNQITSTTSFTQTQHDFSQPSSLL